MLAHAASRNAFQKATCLLLSIIIVGTGLTMGMLAADHAAAQPHYSVTVTQLL